MSHFGKLPRASFTDRFDRETDALAAMRFHSDRYNSHYVRHSRNHYTVHYYLKGEQ